MGMAWSILEDLTTISHYKVASTAIVTNTIYRIWDYGY